MKKTDHLSQRVSDLEAVKAAQSMQLDNCLRSDTVLIA